MSHMLGRAIFAMLLATATHDRASAGVSAPAYMAMGEAMAPPIGFVAWCRQSSDACGGAIARAIGGGDQAEAVAFDSTKGFLPDDSRESSSASLMDGCGAAPAIASPLAPLTHPIQMSPAPSPGGRLWRRAADLSVRSSWRLRETPPSGTWEAAKAIPACMTIAPQRWEPDDDGGFRARISREIASNGTIASVEVGPAIEHSGHAWISAPAGGLRHKEQIALLKYVNRYVNRHVLQRSDLRTTGQADTWRPSGVAPGAVGDCEDIALEKQRELIQRGFSPTRLALAIAYSRAAGLHAVLIARTDGGDVVLDSRSARLLQWHDAPYDWISIQSMDDPLKWFRAQT